MGLQSFVLGSALPLSDTSYAGSDILIQGMELSVIRVALHKLYLKTEGFSGYVEVAIRSVLPVNGVSLILGNIIAGNKMFTLPKVMSMMGNSDLDPQLSFVFPACVLTCTQQKKLGDMVNLSESFSCWDEPLLSTPLRVILISMWLPQ